MRKILIATFLMVSVLLANVLMAQDDLADVPNEDRRVEGNEQQRYFLIGAASDAKPPEQGYALLLVLPGGDGSAEFNPFIRRIWKHALPEGFLVAQLVAQPVLNRNQVVWPTAKDRQANAGLHDRVVHRCRRGRREEPVHDRRQTHLRAGVVLGRPGGIRRGAARADADHRIVRRNVVFHPANYPPLKNAKDRRFYLLQSPADQVTKYIFATNAKRQLSAAGAKVELKDYAGGHGWHGDIFGNIREGIGWLDRRE
jgi:hypothetical protein